MRSWRRRSTTFRAGPGRPSSSGPRAGRPTRSRKLLHQLWIDKSFFLRCPDRTSLDIALRRHRCRALDERRPATRSWSSIEEEPARRRSLLRACLLRPGGGLRPGRRRGPRRRPRAGRPGPPPGHPRRRSDDPRPDPRHRGIRAVRPRRPGHGGPASQTRLRTVAHLTRDPRRAGPAARVGFSRCTSTVSTSGPADPLTWRTSSSSRRSAGAGSVADSSRAWRRSPSSGSAGGWNGRSWDWNMLARDLYSQARREGDGGVETVFRMTPVASRRPRARMA